jgi:hypothetical protein
MRILEGAMEIIDQIYMWKRLYWQAIENGSEPVEAERFANSNLSRNGQVPGRRTLKVHFSGTYLAVGA